MVLRKPHGKAAKYSPAPRVEVPPADELGGGAHAPRHAVAGPERDAKGRFLKGARTVQSSGGRGTRQRLAITSKLGLGAVVEESDFAPFHRAALAFAKVEQKRLRETVAAGQPSPAMDAVVSSAAWQKATSEYLYAKAAKTGDVEMMAKASRLANDSRQNLIAAQHLAEMAAKGAPGGPPPIVIFPTQEPPHTARERPKGPPAAPPSQEGEDDATEGDQ